jgi:hypothetical protein
MPMNIGLQFYKCPTKRDSSWITRGVRQFFGIAGSLFFHCEYVRNNVLIELLKCTNVPLGQSMSPHHKDKSF